MCQPSTHEFLHVFLTVGHEISEQKALSYIPTPGLASTAGGCPTLSEEIPH
ncbi:hypothetical protein LguiB_013370 [Lonicera macranthoides]